MTILPCRDPAQLARLVPLASAEGFRFLDRLVTEWTEGTNRFDQPGETLLIVEINGKTVACGGITRQGETLGRIRRVYVDPHFRHLGFGRGLVGTLIAQAEASFTTLVLFTDNPDATRLYEHFGFIPEDPTSTPDHATHRLNLRAGD